MTTTTETLREACPTCDRVECPDFALRLDYRSARQAAIDIGKSCDEVGPAYKAAADRCHEIYARLGGPEYKDCQSRRFDWRQRALDAESRLRTLTTEAAAGAGGEPRKVDEILTGDALTWATMSRAQLAAEHEVLRRQLLTAREQIAVLVARRRGEP